MSAVPNGYRLMILDPDGTIVETIDLAGYDLHNPIAAGSVAQAVTHAVDRAEERADDAHDEKRRSRSS